MRGMPQRFGLGIVKDIHATAALVGFEKAGEKRLHTDFLKLAHSPQGPSS